LDRILNPAPKEKKPAPQAKSDPAAVFNQKKPLSAPKPSKAGGKKDGWWSN
jgi:hypothetical protein